MKFIAFLFFLATVQAQANERLPLADLAAGKVVSQDKLAGVLQTLKNFIADSKQINCTSAPPNTIMDDLTVMQIFMMGTVNSANAASTFKLPNPGIVLNFVPYGRSSDLGQVTINFGPDLKTPTQFRRQDFTKANFPFDPSNAVFSPAGDAWICDIK